MGGCRMALVWILVWLGWLFVMARVLRVLLRLWSERRLGNTATVVTSGLSWAGLVVVGACAEFVLGGRPYRWRHHLCCAGVRARSPARHAGTAVGGIGAIARVQIVRWVAHAMT